MTLSEAIEFVESLAEALDDGDDEPTQEAILACREAARLQLAVDEATAAGVCLRLMQNEGGDVWYPVEFDPAAIRRLVEQGKAVE